MSEQRVDIDSETIHFDGRWLGREDLAKVIRGLLDGGNYNVAKPSAALEALNTALVDVRTLAFRASPSLADALTQAATKENRTPGSLIRDALAQYLGHAASVPAPAPQPAQATAPAPAPEAAPAAPIATAAPVATAAAPVASKKEPEGKRQTEPSMPAVVDASAQTMQLPAFKQAAPQLPPEEKTPPTPPPGLKPAFVPGPGALKAAGVPAPEGVPSVVVDQSLTPAAVVTEPASPEEAKDAVDLKPKAPGESQEAIERRWFGN